MSGEVEARSWVADAPLGRLLLHVLAGGAALAGLMATLPAPVWARTVLLDAVMLAVVAVAVTASHGRRRREQGRGRVGWTLIGSAFLVIGATVAATMVIDTARRSVEPVPQFQACTGLGLLLFAAGLVTLFAGAPLGSRLLAVVDTTMAGGAILLVVDEALLVRDGAAARGADVIYSDLGGMAVLLVLALLLAARWSGDGRTLALMGAGLGLEAATLIGLAAAAAQGHEVPVDHPVIGCVFPLGTLLLGLGAAQRPTGPTQWAPLRRQWNVSLGVPVVSAFVVAVTALVLTASDRGWDRTAVVVSLAVAVLLFVRQGVTLLQHRRTALDVDPLTGLGNRARLHERTEAALARARRTGEWTCLVSIDLDDFKRLNDVESHAVGDEALVAAASVIRVLVGSRGSVARLGGDEFALLLEDADAAAGEAVARRIVTALQQLPVRGVHLFGVSGGFAAVLVGDTDAAALLRDAGIALHRAKSAGRGRAAVFQPEMREHLVRELVLEQALAEAVAERRLTVVYQPIVELATGRVAGLEGLVRWQDGDGTAVSPSVFIPLAERAGLVGALDEWVLRQACGDLVGLSASCPELACTTLNVNLSARDLTDMAEVERWVRTALAASGLAPHRLMLEITETAVLPEHVSLVGPLQALRDAGVRVALDDFGTGYSSVASLEALPLDELKVDGSFVAGLGAAGTGSRLVEGLVAMARSLRLPVVAEAVETAEQAELLVQMRCEYAQGRHFAMPMPREELAGWVRGRDALAV